jgi:hypothetical protein
MNRFILRAFILVVALVGGVVFALLGNWGTPRKSGVGELQADPRIPRFEFSTRPRPSTDLDVLIESKLSDALSNDATHDFVRRATVRAAISYIYAPCGEYPKRVLVEAVGDYVNAFQKVRACSYFCSTSAVERADDAFTKSDLDRLVTDSIRDAYERGGFSASDFPRWMAPNLAHVAHLSEKEPRVCGNPPPLPYMARHR